MKKALVVYYSVSNGNTKRIAELLQKALNADIARIETVKPYEGSYDEIVSQGKREVESGFEPKIKELAVDFDSYDLVAVGTPTWWYTAAPAVMTFLHSQNWKNKTVVPFMTNGGWPGHVISDMKKACKGAKTVYPGEIQFDSNGTDILQTPIEQIDRWINEVKTLVED